MSFSLGELVARLATLGRCGGLVLVGRYKAFRMPDVLQASFDCSISCSRQGDRTTEDTSSQVEGQAMGGEGTSVHAETSKVVSQTSQCFLHICQAV